MEVGLSNKVNGKYTLVLILFLVSVFCIGQESSTTDLEETERVNLIKKYGSEKLIKSNIQNEEQKDLDAEFHNVEVFSSLERAVLAAGGMEKFKKLQADPKRFYQFLKENGAPISESKFFELINHQMKNKQLKIAPDAVIKRDIGPEGKDPKAQIVSEIEKVERLIEKGRYSKAMSMVLKNMSGLNKESIKESIAKNNENKKIVKIFKKFPRLFDFMIEIVTDQKALPAAAKMIENKKKIFLFVCVNVALYLFGHMIKRFFNKNNERTFLNTVWIHTKLGLMMISIRIMVLVYFFHSELGPTYNLTKKFLFKNFFYN